jgi:hypothetical protein
VVWSALVINTLVDQGPIIFLKLAEGDIGQYDGIIYPSSSTFSGIGDFVQYGTFINYTRVNELVENEYNLAPRKQFCGSKVGSDLPMTQRKNYDQEYLDELE